MRTGEGLLEAGFGCYAPVHPCLGMRVAEFALATPIMGFAGDLRYFPGMEFASLGRDGLITLLEGVEESLRPLPAGARFEGFYGLLFDAPVTRLRFAWQEDFSNDDGAVFRFSDMILVSVPEPPLLAAFAAATLLMVAGGRQTRVARAWFRCRRRPSHRSRPVPCPRVGTTPAPVMDAEPGRHVPRTG